jgi:hypothetical protein
VTVDPAQIVNICKAAHLRSKDWGNHRMALHALVEWVSKLHVGEKSDGEVWAPATFGGKRRLAGMVQGVDLAVFDSDAGHTLAEIEAAIRRTGWYARIVPSSSWGRDVTEASADHYDEWAGRQPDSSGLASRYLTEVLAKVPAVAVGAMEIGRPVQTVVRKDGGKQLRHLVRFRHGPCEKYRIICVLSQRYDLSTPQARRAWKKHYDAMIDVVGLPLDRSTGSPERLFFLSYLSPDRIAQARLHQAEIKGASIDVSLLPEPKPRERSRRGGRHTFAEDHIEGRGSDDDHLEYAWRDPVTGREIDLRKDAAKGVLRHLELADVLQENGWPQDERGEVDGKHHIECPFAHEHTDQNDGGTFVWNASDYGRTGMTDLQPGAGINCRHNSCDGRDRLEFILEFLRRGGLKPGNLMGALGAARDKGLADDFEPIDPDQVVLRALVKPDMSWTRDKVCASASSLRRLKREASARFDELAAGWDALDTITLDELELLVDLADDETDDGPGPEGGGSPSPRRWRDELRYAKDGTPLASATNISLCLGHGLGLGGGAVAYNQLKDRLDIRDPTRLPWAKPGEVPRPWSDNDDTEAAMALDQLLGGLVIRPHTVTPLIEALGRRHAFHPVREYLGGLVWDGIPRLDRLLIDHGGALDNPFVRAATARTLIAAVARAMKPGCKVDTALILESTQGFGKSTLFSALAVDPEYFSDSTGHIGEQTSAEMACTHWVVEMAELAGLTKGDLNQIKAFLSRRYDKFRPAYGRRVVDYPRQCIMVGTVNPEIAGYLKDLTGNRRFWIVKVDRIDWSYVDDWRDQLWAEAKARYDAGEKWWLDDDKEADLVKAQQETAKERTAEPELCESLREFIAKRPGVSGHDLDFTGGWTPRPTPLTVIPSATHYWNAVGRPTRDITFSNKVAFNQGMQALGWEVHQERRETNPIGLERGSRFYISPEGVEAHKDGRLSAWLAAQAGLGAVAGLPNPLEGLENIIILEDRKKPKPKNEEDPEPAKKP